jgi:GNAT superfamily N-acetyltransferase
MTVKTKVVTRPLTPDLWPAFERLFGENGACGGCWCMHWRREKGESWDDIKGAEAKRRMRALVLAGKSEGVLAFEADLATPIGWCAFGKRTEFARLDRSPSLKCDDAASVYSVPCFFVHRRWRGHGVAGLLLRAAVAAIRERGGRIIEGYPVRQKKPGVIPAAFAYTGVPSLFAKEGFSVVATGGKLRVRKIVRARRREE